MGFGIADVNSRRRAAYSRSPDTPLPHTKEAPMLDFTKHVTTRLRHLVTPQSEAIPESAQVPNSDTGYAWPVDKWVRLDRFLILGSEGGTFYVGERVLTQENAGAVAKCIAEDGV